STSSRSIACFCNPTGVVSATLSTEPVASHKPRKGDTTVLVVPPLLFQIAATIASREAIRPRGLPFFCRIWKSNQNHTTAIRCATTTPFWKTTIGAEAPGIEPGSVMKNKDHPDKKEKAESEPSFNSNIRSVFTEGASSHSLP